MLFVLEQEHAIPLPFQGQHLQYSLEKKVTGTCKNGNLTKTQIISVHTIRTTGTK